MSNVDVAPAQEQDRDALRQLIELYAYDFSEFNGTEIGDDGRYGYRYFDAYWTEPERHPFLFRVDGHLAGFALVRAGDPHDMAEFFVMRKYRRSGWGSTRPAQCSPASPAHGRPVSNSRTPAPLHSGGAPSPWRSTNRTTTKVRSNDS